MPETKASVEAAQRACNAFTKKFLSGVQPLIVDGRKGKATISRIKLCKFYLGWGKRDAKVTRTFLALCKNPHRRAKDYPDPPMRRRGMARRAKQRARWAQQRAAAAFKPGVTTYNGVPVAKWLQPYLVYARNHGWKGRLNSGWRSPAYSDSLCRRICGRPSCPGICAGRASNHSGNARPRGAVDVSDYVTFGRLMRACPYSPRIYNALGARDPVHHSASGR